MQRDQAKELLTVIRKRGTSAFNKFVEVLLESDTMSFLGKLLKEEREDDKQYGKHMYPAACIYRAVATGQVCRYLSDHFFQATRMLTCLDH